MDSAILLRILDAIGRLPVKDQAGAVQSLREMINQQGQGKPQPQQAAGGPQGAAQPVGLPPAPPLPFRERMHQQALSRDEEIRQAEEAKRVQFVGGGWQ